VSDNSYSFSSAAKLGQKLLCLGFVNVKAMLQAVAFLKSLTVCLRKNDKCAKQDPSPENFPLSFKIFFLVPVPFFL
jgi:hypothetical protein